MEQGLVPGRSERLSKCGNSAAILGGAVNGGGAEDEVTIAIMWAGPDMFTVANEEIREKTAVLKSAIEEVRAEGLTPDGVVELREVVMTSHFQAFWWALSGDSRRTWNCCGSIYPGRVCCPGAVAPDFSREGGITV